MRADSPPGKGGGSSSAAAAGGGGCAASLDGAALALAESLPDDGSEGERLQLLARRPAAAPSAASASSPAAGSTPLGPPPRPARAQASLTPRMTSFRAARARLRLAEAVACLVSVALIWVGASLLVQRLFADAGAQLPFFLTYVCVSEFVVLLPLRAARERWLPRGATLAALPGGCSLALAPAPPSDWRAAARAAALVCPLWFAAQSSYNASLGGTTVSASTVLSTTSCVWTFGLSVALLGERFDARRLAGVVLTLAGAGVVSWGDARVAGAGAGGGGGGGSATTTWWGDALALGSAVAYGLYTTAIRRLVPGDGRISLSAFFGFLGLFNSVLMLPIVLGLAAAGVEDVRRHATPTFMGWVLLKGLLDNVLSDVLWGHAIVLSSATLATVGLSLTIPIAMLAELAMTGRAPPPHLLGGSALVLVGFFATTLATEGAGDAPKATPAGDAKATAGEAAAVEAGHVRGADGLARAEEAQAQGDSEVPLQQGGAPASDVPWHGEEGVR